MSRTLIKNTRLEPLLNAALYNLEISYGCINDIVIADEKVIVDEMKYDTIVDAKGAVAFPGMQGIVVWICINCFYILHFSF